MTDPGTNDGPAPIGHAWLRREFELAAPPSAVVDMPDGRASLLIRLCMQNGGRLSKRKRGTFAEITEPEMAALEAAIQQAMAAETARD